MTGGSGGGSGAGEGSACAGTGPGRKGEEPGTLALGGAATGRCAGTPCASAEAAVPSAAEISSKPFAYTLIPIPKVIFKPLPPFVRSYTGCLPLASDAGATLAPRRRSQ